MIFELKTDLVKGVVQEIKPNIYGVIIKNDYDRAMLFCRYQEFYESPYKEINGKYFTLQYFMKVYMKKRKCDVFRYHKDWSGFNLPSHIFFQAYEKFYNDNEEYNKTMKFIYESIIENRKENKSKFYLIGTEKINSITTKHEIAHGFYYTNPDYKNEMDTLITNMDKNEYKQLYKELVDLGYKRGKQIIYDEIQAYLSTELINTKRLKSKEEFREVYKKYYNG